MGRDETGDVAFIVETEKIRVHRWVLAAASTKFKVQFYGPKADQGDIRISNVLPVGNWELHSKNFYDFFLKRMYYSVD